MQPFPSDCENLDKESDETLSAARALRLGFALPHILGGQANHRMSSVKSEKHWVHLITTLALANSLNAKNWLWRVWGCCSNFGFTST